MNLDALASLHSLDASIRRLDHVSTILQWDQETYLPLAAVEERADQLADIEGIAHERATDPLLGQLLAGLGSTTENPLGDESLPAVERYFLRAMRRDYDRRSKLPHDFVVAMARDEGLSQAAWAAARKSNDFPSFAPHLRTMVEYAKKRAAFWGFSARPYDGLIDEHEPGMDAATLSSLFVPLSAGLSALIRRIAACPQPDAEFFAREFPVGAQSAYCEKLMEDLGFDRSRGRLDISAHPFTTTLGADDVRITTRYFPDNVLSGLFSVIHETGHALYELGYDAELRGTRLADGASMGIHESQSRLWENIVGRSRAFWKGRFSTLQEAFPDALSGVDTERFYKAVNIVKPSLIRVDADEVTYSVHIALRFDLEQRLFSGSLDVEDLPGAWREGMMRLLGIEPDTDADGVLQDIHWSMGAFGYFPSYALGNLYGAQFWEALRQDIPDVDNRIERGDFSVILNWFRDKIHRFGRSLPPEELAVFSSGMPLDERPFLRYLDAKYSDLYGF